MSEQFWKDYFSDNEYTFGGQIRAEHEGRAIWQVQQKRFEKSLADLSRQPGGPVDLEHSSSKPRRVEPERFTMPKVRRYHGRRLFLFIRHGEGTAEHENGWRYEGRWSFGWWSGDGTLTCPGQWSYRGSFVAGKPHGRGELRLEDGRSYVGRFKRGFPGGKGVLELRDGTRFVGRWSFDGRARGKCEIGGRRRRAQIRNGQLVVWRGLVKTDVVTEFDARRIYHGR